jgi:hypothetical protein
MEEALKVPCDFFTPYLPFGALPRPPPLGLGVEDG